MDTDSSALEQLPRDECMRLMGSVPVGRIVYTRQALPAVEMVNFTLVDGDIVIRTSAEGKLAAVTRGAVVAFEADSGGLRCAASRPVPCSPPRAPPWRRCC